MIREYSLLDKPTARDTPVFTPALDQLQQADNPPGVKRGRQHYEGGAVPGGEERRPSENISSWLATVSCRSGRERRPRLAAEPAQ